MDEVLGEIGRVLREELGLSRPPRPEDDLIADLQLAARSRWGLSFLDAQERETELPFASLYERARRAAGGLRDLGVEAGDRVAIILPTGEEFMDAFFGAVLAGAVPVPLYPPVRLARLEEFHGRTARLLRTCGARIVLTDGRVGRLLGQAASRARPELGVREMADLPH